MYLIIFCSKNPETLKTLDKSWSVSESVKDFGKVSELYCIYVNWLNSTIMSFLLRQIPKTLQTTT